MPRGDKSTVTNQNLEDDAALLAVPAGERTRRRADTTDTVSRSRRAGVRREGGARMVGLKDAVASATNFVTKLYSDKGTDFMLEEVETSEDGNWLVTIGFSVPEPAAPLDEILNTRRLRRVYKQVKVDAESGVTLSLRIRKV